MSQPSASSRLLRRANALEDWIEASKGSVRLLPARWAGYAALFALMMASNLAAVCWWPVARLLGTRRGGRRASEGASGSHVGGEPIAVGQSELDRFVETGRPVLVDFWAAWCGPCVMMESDLERLAEETGEACLVAKVDTSRHAEVAEACAVKGLPTLVLFAGGEEAARHTGALSESGLRSFLEEHLGEDLFTGEASQSPESASIPS